MQPYSDVIQDPSGNALRGIAVSVLQAGLLVSLYADEGGTTPADNPMRTGANGRFSFYAPKGQYEIWVNGALQEHITLFDTTGLNTAVSVPTTGTGIAGDYVKNGNIAVLGPAGAQYVVDGWKCVVGGSPGTWVEIRLAVAIPASLAPPSTAPSPAPAPSGGLYSFRIQAENMSGAVLGSSQPGYDGTGYADYATSTSPLSGTFTGVPAGTFDLNIGYFVFGAQQNAVQIDSATAVDYMYSTAGAFSVLTIPNVTLGAGSHTIKLIADWGFTHYDYVELVQQGAAASPAPSPAPAPSVSTGGPNYPFGSRTDGAYPHGITVTGYTNSQMDALVEACYVAWKNNRLAAAPAFTPTAGVFAGTTIADGYFVKFRPPNPGEVTYAAVSEGMGYGMLICVLMAGYENTRPYFDGLFKVARGCPAYAMTATAGANQYLIDYQILPDMSSGGGGYSAADGDMDMALALLMAHRQWGSTGAINYYQEALNTIGALKAADFAGNGVMWAPWQDVSRTSDYMPGHFRAFKAATNDTFWDDARTNSLALINTIVSGFSATAHLTPGWIYQPLSATPQPSPGNKIESPYEGDYDANAVRNPWRWGTDYLLSGDTGWKALADNIVTTLKASCSGDPTQTTWAYTLAGAALFSGLYFEPTTCGCLMVGAMTDAAHQTFLNALFAKNTGSYTVSYFAAELQLLPLIVASGNWWKP